MATRLSEAEWFLSYQQDIQKIEMDELLRLAYEEHPKKRVVLVLCENTLTTDRARDQLLKWARSALEVAAPRRLRTRGGLEIRFCSIVAGLEQFYGMRGETFGFVNGGEI